MSAQVLDKIDSNINESLNFKNYIKKPSGSLVPEDKTDINAVKLFAYSVCKDYLGGVWENIDLEQDFKIERASGGLSNYLYRCEISTNCKPIGNEPTSIFLRLYGENHKKNSSIVLKDVVVNAIMSNYSIGPKLYGIFPAGRLEELIPASPMESNDLQDEKISCQIAKIMAQFHTLDMPFIKQPNWLFDTTTKYMKQAEGLKFTKENDIRNFNKINSFNLQNEFLNLKTVLESINSVVVFCHNDINVGNILKLQNKLMIIDYEYGSYNYRGFDFGNFFCEYTFNNNYEYPPYFQHFPHKYPNRESQLVFIRTYLKNFKEITDKNRSDTNDIDTGNEEDNSKTINSFNSSITLDEEHLLLEANYFALASHLFWAWWAVCQAASSKIKFEYLEYALARCDAYFSQKKVLFPNNF